MAWLSSSLAFTAADRYLQDRSGGAFEEPGACNQRQVRAPCCAGEVAALRIDSPPALHHLQNDRGRKMAISMPLAQPIANERRIIRRAGISRAAAILTGDRPL